MKNIKKIIALVLSLGIMTSLVACGNSEENTSLNTSVIPTAGSQTTTTTTTTTTNTVYVSPTAKADGAGTKENPVSFSMAYSQATPGTTILLAEGTYKSSNRQQFFKSGSQGHYITVKPEVEGTRVIFDFSEMAFDGTNRGFQIYGDYWHFYRIEICGAGDNGMYVAGSHNVIEECLFYNNRDTGLQIGRAYSENTHLDEWPAYNLILNCTSYANYDAETLGENADGYAAKLTIGYGNVFDGCIAYRNSDDGWDLFAKVDSGNIGTVHLYNCVSFENGYLPYPIKAVDANGNKYDTYNTPNGDGIGFKLGGSTMEGDVVLENCMSFNNKLHGYGDNSNPGFISISNSTAFNNCMGLNSDGTVSSNRGITGEGANKSNNIDLARSTASYNNYYGVLSYINNQTNFSTENDNNYNSDSFRGSVGYSIFTTGYSDGETYTSFTDYVDGSSYHSSITDYPYSGGTKGSNVLSDSSFASLTPINAICSSVNDLDTIRNLHYTLRNSDGSVNMGDHLRVVDQKLLTYANGSQIGACLNKTNYDSYKHSNFVKFMQSDAAELSDIDVDLISAYSFASPITNIDATLQDFDVPRLITGCDITWTSSNDDVLHVNPNEISSVSNSVFSRVEVIVPTKEEHVTLTATITKKGYYLTKSFEITVLPRNQALGELSSTSSNAIRVELYSTYNEPRIYALDASATGDTELSTDLYTLEKTYRFASSAKSTFYDTDGVYTSVPGVYETTVVATSKATNTKSTFVYNVYVVDPECEIDFMDSAQNITLSQNGVKVSGDLSNIEGSVAGIISKTELTNLTASDFVNSTTYDVQYVDIETDTIEAEFKADNMNVSNTEIQYYLYYVVLNKNRTNLTNTVRSVTITTAKIDNEKAFHDLARGVTASSSTVIYSLTRDLDFSTVEGGYVITDKASSKAFSGLFNGNGHTIKNINISANTTDSSTEKYYNVFYKVSNGAIVNVNFDNITINNPQAKVVGVIGDLQGGYLYNIKLTNIGMVGKESIGGLVGQVTGGTNYISNVSLINPLPDANVTDHSTTVANDYIPTTYKFSSSNKYTGGIVGNVQMNSDQTTLTLYIDSCSVVANIGDGNDAQGNTGGIVGRVKNDSSVYYTSITNSVFYGTIISKGQYQGGMIGDLDNGSGYVYLYENVSGARFVWNSTVLDAYVAAKASADQKYAHKNSNPMIGRATKGETGVYEVDKCFGTWTEYYESNGVYSTSFAFDLSIEDDEGYVQLFYPSETWWKSIGFDLDNIWVYDATTNFIRLK